MPRHVCPLAFRRVPFAGLLVSLVLLLVLDKPWEADFDLFEPPGDEATFGRFVETWIWWASAINLVVAAVLAVGWSWWTKETGIEGDRGGREVRDLPRFQWLLLVLSVGVAASSGLPRLSQSLWGDELITFGESVGGQFSHDVEEDGLEASMDRIYWSGVGWGDAVWGYETPNPHFLYNLGGKLALGLSQKVRGDKPWVVRESALRLLPFLAGLGALGGWFVLAGRWGAGTAAGWFCLVLSLHPWFIRYITEARGYAFVFLLLPLSLLALGRALRDPRWRNWVVCGILGGMLLLSWPGMVVPWACLTVAALFRDVASPGSSAAYPRRRLVLTNVVLGMFLVLWMAPCFFQLGPYLREDAPRLPLDAAWLRDLAARMLFGIDWHDHGAYSRMSPRYISFESLWRTPAFAVPLAAVGAATVVGLVAGIVFIARGGMEFRRLWVGIAVSPILIYALAALAGVYLFHWYFIYLLPPVVMVAVAGLVGFVRSRGWARIPVILVLAGYAVVSFRGSAALRARSVDPRRESALAARGTLDPADPRNAGILTAHVGTTSLGYDPLGWALAEPQPGASDPGLPALMRMADVLGRELRVNVGYPSNARAEAPTVMGIIDKSGFFERIHVFPGLEPQFEREIYRYKGGMFGSLRKKPVE